VSQRQGRLALRPPAPPLPGNPGRTAPPTAAGVWAVGAQGAVGQGWLEEHAVAPLSGGQPHHRLLWAALGLDSAW
jgi:hypothetical protein